MKYFLGTALIILMGCNPEGAIENLTLVGGQALNSQGKSVDLKVLDFGHMKEASLTEYAPENNLYADLPLAPASSTIDLLFSSPLLGDTIESLIRDGETEKELPNDDVDGYVGKSGEAAGLAYINLNTGELSTKVTTLYDPVRRTVSLKFAETSIVVDGRGVDSILETLSLPPTDTPLLVFALAEVLKSQTGTPIEVSKNKGGEPVSFGTGSDSIPLAGALVFRTEPLALTGVEFIYLDAPEGQPRRLDQKAFILQFNGAIGSVSGYLGALASPQGLMGFNFQSDRSAALGDPTRAVVRLDGLNALAGEQIYTVQLKPDETSDVYGMLLGPVSETMTAKVPPRVEVLGGEG